MEKSPDSNKGETTSEETSGQKEDVAQLNAASGEQNTSPTAAIASTVQAETQPPVNTTPGRVREAPARTPPGPPHIMGMSSPATVPPKPKTQGAEAAATGSKKRAREESSSGGGGGRSASKVQKTIVNEADLPFGCSLCERRFATLQASCGHMRRHSGRDWKGLHPPPVFNRDGSPPLEQDGDQSELASTLLNLAKGSAKKITSSGQASGSGGPSGTTMTTEATQGRGINIDLNVAVTQDQDSDPSPPPPPRRTPRNFDLNKTPPRDSDDEVATP